MVVEGAAETELMFANAAHRWYNAAEVAGFDCTVDSIFAVGCWAPTEVILIIHIRPCEERAIPKASVNVSHRLSLTDKGVLAYRSCRALLSAKSSSRDLESTMR